MEYVRELEYLQRLSGPQEYIAALFQRPTVLKDQWEVEMWCKVLQKVQGPAGLIYCTNGISAGDLEKLPLTSGYAYTGEQELGRMVQNALQHTVTAWQQRLGRSPRLGVILDGAHAIPCLTPTSTDA